MTPDSDRSIEDDLRDAMASIEQPEPVEVAPEPVTEEAPPESEKGPSRGPDGKFAAKSEGDGEPAAVESAAPAEAAPAEEAPILPDPYGLAPATWTKETKEKWAELPSEIRAEITRREKDVHVMATRFDEERQFGKRVKDVVAPYEGFIKSLGAEPVQAFDYLIKTDYALRTAQPEQRKALFLKAAKDYGIDLSGNVPDMTMSHVDPTIETMQQQIARLERERNDDIMRVKETEQQQIVNRIQDFASRPENVYFDRVQPVMATLIQSGQADTLEKAYDMAVFADPETRALHLAAQDAERERKRTTDATAAADRARQASVSVTGAPGLAVQTPISDRSASLEDDIRSAIRAANGRA